MAKVAINLKEGKLEKKEEKKSKEDLIVGIDLGTTNSLVAFIDKESGRPVCVTDKKGMNKLLPSIVYFTKNGSVLVGKEAKEYLTIQPERTVYSAKRLMGKSYADMEKVKGRFGYQIIDDDKEGLVKIKIDEQFFTPIELSAHILRSLKVKAEVALQRGIHKAVITVPAYFNDTQRQATRDAGKLAGLDVLRIINEPTAASLAYGIGLAEEEEKTVAVYDLGGGTFDISILKISNGIFEVLATNGDTFLGGDDFDQLILDYWKKEGVFSEVDFEQEPGIHQTLRLKAEMAKTALSRVAQYYGGKAGISLNMSRNQFEELANPLVQTTINITQQALKDAGLTVKDIDDIILVGGSTRLPIVKKMLSAFFGKPVNDTLNPEEVVAMGAALQADILAGNRKDLLLLDVTPLSLGIETMGGLMDVIIPRNSKVPAKAKRQYTTQVDGQVNMKIAVYQGERDLVRDNRKLGEFDLKGIPAMPAGLPKVEISFIIDADGILQVRATELRSGVAQQIDITSQYGLSPEEIAGMLKTAIQQAEKDREQRALQEALNEGNSILGAARRFLAKNEGFLNEEEQIGTREKMSLLEKSLLAKNKDSIHQHITLLNEYTRPFAERLMDMAIAEAMKGKKN